MNFAIVSGCTSVTSHLILMVCVYLVITEIKVNQFKLLFCSHNNYCGSTSMVVLAVCTFILALHTVNLLVALPFSQETLILIKGIDCFSPQFTFSL